MKEKFNMCINCKNYSKGCSWSEELKPVEGWVAVETVTYDKQPSFEIKYCPKFQEDFVQVTAAKLCEIWGLKRGAVDYSLLEPKKRIKHKIHILKEEANKRGLELRVCKINKLRYYYIRKKRE